MNIDKITVGEFLQATDNTKTVKTSSGRYLVMIPVWVKPETKQALSKWCQKKKTYMSREIREMIEVFVSFDDE